MVPAPALTGNRHATLGHEYGRFVRQRLDQIFGNAHEATAVVVRTSNWPQARGLVDGHAGDAGNEVKHATDSLASGARRTTATSLSGPTVRLTHR